MRVADLRWLIDGRMSQDLYDRDGRVWYAMQSDKRPNRYTVQPIYEPHDDDRRTQELDTLELACFLAEMTEFTPASTTAEA